MKKYREQLHDIEGKKYKQNQLKNKYSNDRAGYCLYVFDRLETNDKDFLESYLSFIIPESQRLLHTYISGGTGSGKSEIMKTLLHHYLTKDTRTALVLIDPHGKIAQETAQFKENVDNDRLIFISPDFSPTHSPVFNVFDNPNPLDTASPRYSHTGDCGSV